MKQIVENYKKVEIEDEIWDKIIEFQHGNDSIIFPANNEKVKEFLNKKLPQGEFNKFIANNGFKASPGVRAVIKGRTVQAALEKYQGIDVMEKFAKQLEEWEFSEEERKTFDELIELNKEFKELRSQLFLLLSKKKRHASEYDLNTTESVRKLLRYYTPAHSEYVMKLVGEIKHKGAVSNSIYMLANMFRFVLKQYSNELEERIRKLEDTYRKTEAQMVLLRENGIITPTGNGTFEATTDLQTIIVIILKVWKQVFEKENSQVKSFGDAHPIKIQEYSLNMFIALSSYMVKLKNEGEELHKYPDFISNISEEFAALVSNNLKYLSFSQRLFQKIGLQSPDNSTSSINSKTFEYKLELMHKIMSLEDSSPARKSKNDPCSVTNETKIKNSIEHVLKELTISRRFVMDPLFVRILSLDDNGSLKRSTDGGSNDRYDEERKLSEIMCIVSSAIASEAGIKVNSYDLKYLVLAKTLATLALNYALSSTKLQEWVPAPMRVVMHLHSVSYISSHLQQIIDNQEAKAKSEFNKYNDIDKSFNKAISYLFGKKMIYPKLGGGASIDYLICDERVHIYLHIVARILEESKLDLQKDINPEDLAAVAKILFREISVNCTPVTEKEEKPKEKGKSKEKKNEFKENRSKSIETEHINDISESLGQLIRDECTGKEIDYFSLSKTIRIAMELYIKQKFCVPVKQSDAGITNNIAHSTSTDSTTSAGIGSNISISTSDTSTSTSTSTDTSVSNGTTSSSSEASEDVDERKGKKNMPIPLKPSSSAHRSDKKKDGTPSLDLGSVKNQKPLKDSPRVPSAIREGVRNWVYLVKKEKDPKANEEGVYK
ncbi:MAG: hypothetical protein K0R73_417 [Candidatus Midichloriaceae bacterium]|jgi:hypothetical protein|nr:hypothetical protein [Candidatus Midichloriaceae bacterium]